MYIVGRLHAVEDIKKDKINRVLGIYSRLVNGDIINKSEEALRYGVNEKSIQRDIEDIREYFDNELLDSGSYNSIVYDRLDKGYRLEHIYNMKLTNAEILAICKILLDSRAFTKKEIDSMVERLIECCAPKNNQELVKKLIGNEQYHYIELPRKSEFLDDMWKIGEAISRQKYIEIDYQGIQGSSVKTRKLKPVAIMFSEYYFYLCAFIENDKVKENFTVLDDAFPTIYRIDRIQRLEILEDSFKVIYNDRFEEGEFRKRVQFMFGGKLRRVKFEYSGYSVESVLDRLPTAKILDERKHEDGKRTIYTISAEVFGDGIDMWLRSQGEYINVLN